MVFSWNGGHCGRPPFSHAIPLKTVRSRAIFGGNRVLRYIYLESSRTYSTPERFEPGIIMTKRPLDILDQVLNRQPVIVSLKGGREIRGILQGYDVHMNLVLDKAEEVVNGQVQKVGMLIVRGDNVIYISPSVE
jgi:small nuclear ribonucleoprotein